MVFGEYNIQDNSSADISNRGTYIEIVGKGTASNARSNARTLDWNGNEQISGSFTPMTSNSQTLGSSTNRWSKVYIGNSNSYGSATTPIYWNDGIPTPITSINVPSTSTAAALTNARQLGVKLDSNTAATFNGSADQLNIPVAGVLKVANGGTGYNSVDTTPTANSARMVTSGGVKSAIDQVVANVNSIKYAASNSVGGAANSVANAITFNNSGSGVASGSTYNGSAARTISYNTIGAASSSHTHNYAGSNSAGGAATNALSANTAVKLTTGRTLQVNLGSTSPSTAFDGTQNISNIGVSGTLTVGNGGTGFTTTTYKNAVVIGNSTAATSALQTIRTSSGAFYATAADAKPGFGTLPVAQGGTGNTAVDTTPTANSTKMVTSGGLYTALAGKANSSHTHNYAGSASAGGAANSVANALTFSTAGNGGGNGTTYNGSVARTISYNSVGAAAANHTHNYAGSSSAGGAANSALTANQLTTARTIQTNLGSTTAASFNGTANITPGVTGILNVANGGTGKSSWTNKGILYANSATSLAQLTPSGANQILMSNSSSVPAWTVPLNSLDSISSTPPTSSAVYNAINNIHIENLGPLSSTYVWDTLSSTTYYITSETSGSTSSSIDPTVWKISTWTSCTAINATTLQLSGNPVVYTMPDGGHIDIPAGRYCLVELNTTANPYNTTSQVFYTGSSSKRFNTREQTVGGTYVGGQGVTMPVVAITYNGQTTYYPQGSQQYDLAPLATVGGATYQYTGLSAGYGGGTVGGSVVKYYISATGTVITAGGAKQASAAWQTETGTSTMYTHGRGSSIIHLCRGSLADILLGRRMGVYTGNGGSSTTINFDSWVPKLLMILETIYPEDTSTRRVNVVIDTYNLRGDLQPTINYMGTTVQSLQWGNNNCKSITITWTDSSKSYFNKSGVSYKYIALL